MPNLTIHDFKMALTYLRKQPKNQPFELNLFLVQQEPDKHSDNADQPLKLGLHHMLNPMQPQPNLVQKLWYQAFYQVQLGTQFEMEYQLTNLVQQSIKNNIPDFKRLNYITNDGAKIQSQSEQYLYDIESDDLAKPATNAVIIKKLKKLYQLAQFDAANAK